MEGRSTAASAAVPKRGSYTGDRERRKLMSSQDIGWQSELDRRARVYEDIEAGQRWEGTMTRIDYAAIAALTALLVAAFWIWGA